MVLSIFLLVASLTTCVCMCKGAPDPSTFTDEDTTVGIVLFVLLLAFTLLASVWCGFYFRPMFFLQVPWIACIFTCCGNLWRDCNPQATWALPLIFCTYVLLETCLVRGYLVGCRRLWLDLIAASEATSQEDLTQKQVHDYCNSTNLLLHSQNAPVWYPMGRPVRFLEQGSLLANMTRGTCWSFTCRLTEQHESYAWLFFLALFVIAAATVIYVVNPNVCSDDCRQTCGKWFGMGRCRVWCMWFWLFLIPFWLILYVTLVKGFNYRDLVAETGLVFEQLFKDMYRLVFICTACICFVFIYIYRRKVVKALGIEDSNIIHLTLQDFIHAGWRSDQPHFQVCVWKVLCNPVDPADPKGIPEDVLKSGGGSFTWRDVTTMLQQFSSDVVEEGRGGRGADYHRLGSLPGIGKKCHLFVRLALGDNEPQHSRVHIIDQVMEDGQNQIKQAFLFNMENQLAGTALYVTVRNQEVYGSTEIGRIVMEYSDLEAELNASNDKEKGLLDQSVPLSTQQLRLMLSKNPDVKEAPKLGFKVRQLSEGGSIVLAFATLKD